MTILLSFILASTVSAGSVRVEQIFPGIWRLTFGKPEGLTPTTFRSAKPSKEGLESLGRADLPFPARAIAFRRTSRGSEVVLPFHEHERFYGLGLSTSTFELSGRKAWTISSDHPEAQTNESHAPEPFYVSSRGYGVYVDTARSAVFTFGGNATQSGSSPKVTVEVPGAQGVDIYLFAAPSPLLAVQRYELFSGGGPIPPLWGLGMAYRGKGDATSSDMIALAKSFRDSDLPCDIFGVEPGWQTHTYSCSFLWNHEKFPDPDEFIRSMHSMGYRMSFWEHPFTHPTSPIHEALKPYSGSHLVWGGLVPDFATPQARKVFVDMQEKSLFSKGVESVKIDEVDSQPFRSDPWSFPDYSLFPSGLDGEQMHSLFGLLSQQALLSPFRNRGLRTWGLVRNSGALASTLPYTIYSDTYDHTCYLRGLVKSGFGSHMWTPEVRDAKSVADLVRRVQTVIFSPYAMINCWYMKMPPWLQIDADKSNAGQTMAEAAEATHSVRVAFKLRMSLLPYLYSAFGAFRQTGMPPIRALCLDYPEDALTAGIDDQFMFGPSLLVAPFIDGTSKRSVYLPKGGWFDYFTGQRIEGGRRIDVQRGLDEMPLYVKEDTILPIAVPVNRIGRDTVLQIRPEVFGRNPAPFTLLEDDGETLDFEKGLQNKVSLTFRDGAGKVERTGPYKGRRYEIGEWRLRY